MFPPVCSGLAVKQHRIVQLSVCRNIALVLSSYVSFDNVLILNFSFYDMHKA